MKKTYDSTYIGTQEKGENRRGNTTWGCVNIQHLNEISYQKVQIINLNRVLMIICRGTNGTGQSFTSLFRDKLSLQGARIETPYSSPCKYGYPNDVPVGQKSVEETTK